MSVIRKAMEERYRHRRPRPPSLPSPSSPSPSSATVKAVDAAAMPGATGGPAGGALALLPPGTTTTRSLLDLRNKYITTVFCDPEEEGGGGGGGGSRGKEKQQPWPEPQWQVYLQELVPGRARGFTRNMKRELAFKAKYVNQTRLMLRVLLSWRGYVDQFAYARDMLVRVHRLKFVHKVFVAWWTALQRDMRLRVIIRTRELKAIWRRFRLWSLLTAFHNRARRLLRLCVANWRFYVSYKLRLLQDLAGLFARALRIPASIAIQKTWRGARDRRLWRARKRIAYSLFWRTKVWRRVYRARLRIEARRHDKEERVLALVASRTILAVKEHLQSLQGGEDFARFREKLDRHYREYDMDFLLDERKGVWVDVRRPRDVKVERAVQRFLPSILRTAAKDFVRNVVDLSSTTTSPSSNNNKNAAAADSGSIKVKAYRVIEDRCVRDIKQTARAYYRRKHPPPFECGRCHRIFVLATQLRVHEQHAAKRMMAGMTATTMATLNNTAATTTTINNKMVKGADSDGGGACGGGGEGGSSSSKNQGYAWYVAGDFVQHINDQVLRTFYADMVGRGAPQV